jgi:hypothetical protein
LGGSASMTVCTNDVALGHLVADAAPIAVPETLADAEFLFAEMVELENDWVLLTAIDARMILEVLDQVGDPLEHDPATAFGCPIHVALLIRRVMRLLVRRSTWPAIVVPLPFRLSSPCKLFEWLRLAAAAASSHRPATYTDANGRSYGLEPTRES